MMRHVSTLLHSLKLVQIHYIQRLIYSASCFYVPCLSVLLAPLDLYPTILSPTSKPTAPHPHFVALTMPPPPQLSSAWPTVRASSHNAGWSPAPTREATPSIPTKFVSAAQYVHLEVFDLDADGVPMSSVRTFVTSTIGDALTPLGPPEVATEFVTCTAASRVRAIHPSLFDVDAQGVPVSTARAFATHSSIPTESTVFMPADLEVLPDLPAWVFGFLAGCAAFISIVASALLLAQFRPQMRCAVRIGRWIKGNGRGSGYWKLEQEDYELDIVYRSGYDGALHGRDHGSDGLKNRKGHSTRLSVNTRQQYAELGEFDSV